jgi:hypothetical protein
LTNSGNISKSPKHPSTKKLSQNTPHFTIKMRFTSASALAILATTTSAQSVDFASLTGAAASKVSSYMAHVTAEPEYASVASVASTAVHTKWQQSFMSGDLSKVSTKSWYAGVPSDIKSFASSIQSEIMKIATGDASAATVTTSASGGSTGAASVSKTAVNAASTSGSSASKSASSSASKASSSAATVSKNGAVETGVGRMMGVAAAGALGALIL